jgi:hypothetical protein
MRRVPFLFFTLLCFFPSISLAKELPKIAVWDLSHGDIKPAYAKDLTSILVSEISKLGKYEVYSQENVRTLAGWTAERMQLGCTDTKCLTALGQMDIAKLISGRVAKIGNMYSVSLNLFDTQNARAEKSVSEFGRSEDELVGLVQVALGKLLGVEVSPIRVEQRPSPSLVKEIDSDGPLILYSNKTVLDKRTNLMWAAQDNGTPVNWANAKSYCENYRGGGYTDWRMPTLDELEGLCGNYIAGAYIIREREVIYLRLTRLIELSLVSIWAWDPRYSDPAELSFQNCRPSWPLFTSLLNLRALPVRSAK